MTLKLPMTVAMALWKTGLPEKSAKYLYGKAEKMLMDERSARESFQEVLEHLSDDALMAYVPDVYQEDIYRIDYARLKANGIKLISFDIDDTIDDSFINKFEANAPLIKDAGDYYEGYPGKVILVGRHDLTKRLLAAVGVFYNSYGMMLGFNQDIYVLRANRASLGKGKAGRKKFEAYYNTRILKHKELADRYNVPMQFGSRDKTRKSQYDLMWLEFATHWLHAFLEEAGGLAPEDDRDIALQAADDLIQKVNAGKDTVYTLDELLRNAYKANESAGIKTFRTHLGDDIVITGVWADARDERELEESELLDGELSGYVFTIGCYNIRSSVCLYQDYNGVHYTQRVPAGRDAIAQYRQEGWRMFGAGSGVREVQVISARHSGVGPAGWQHVCLATTSFSWEESIHFFGTWKPAASAPDEQETLFVLKQYTGSSFGVAYWYKLSPDGTVTEYREHPYE